MNTFVKVIWFVFGGITMSFAWWFAGVLMYLTVVGIPYGRMCFAIAGICTSPFGKSVVRRRDLTSVNAQTSRSIQFLGDVAWFLLCGWWLLLGHLVLAVLLTAITFKISLSQFHVALAQVAISPANKSIVDHEIARALKQRRVVKSARKANDCGNVTDQSKSRPGSTIALNRTASVPLILSANYLNQLYIQENR